MNTNVPLWVGYAPESDFTRARIGIAAPILYGLPTSQILINK